MDSDQISRMKSTKRIGLSKSQLFWHYSIVPFLLIVPILTTWNLIEYYVLGTYEGVRTPKELLTSGSYLFLIPAFILYFIQRARLRLKEYRIPNTNESFKGALEKTARELGWEVEDNKNEYVRLHRKWNWSASWGELITIIRDGDRILINSICDPDAFFISVVSYGWNKKNVKTFLGNLKEKSLLSPN